MGHEEGLVRVKVMRAGRPSSVSMDIFLATVLKESLGGEAELRRWVQSTADELQRVWQEEGRTRTGLSRLIQREALRRVLGARK